MDLISSQLRAVRMSGGIFFRARFSEPFCVETPSCSEVAEMLGLGSRRVVPFHVVVGGTCDARIDGLDAVGLETGDVVVFLHGGTHVVASAEDAGDATPIAPLIPPPPYGRIQEIRHGGGGAVTEMICGFLHHDAAFFNPMLLALPKVLTVGGAWSDPLLPLSQILQLIEDESREQRPGGECLLTRLSELMFMEVLRRYIEELRPDEGGWLSGFQDPFVGQILQRFHSDPGGDWSLETLSREVKLSRSALADRFSRCVGQPPMRYLTSLRMQRATELLRGTDMTVSGVAARVGYGSEVAFHRAFRRLIGAPPAEWRRRNKDLNPEFV